MGAGKYDRRVAAYAPIRTQADNGELVVTFGETPTFSFWASIQPVTGRERFNANQPLADMDARIKAPWSERMAAIDATWKLAYRSTVYNISAPPADVDMQHVEIEFVCNSGKNQG